MSRGSSGRTDGRRGCRRCSERRSVVAMGPRSRRSARQAASAVGAILRAWGFPCGVWSSGSRSWHRTSCCCGSHRASPPRHAGTSSADLARTCRSSVVPGGPGHHRAGSCPVGVGDPGARRVGGVLRDVGSVSVRRSRRDAALPALVVGADSDGSPPGRGVLLCCSVVEQPVDRRRGGSPRCGAPPGVRDGRAVRSNSAVTCSHTPRPVHPIRKRADTVGRSGSRRQSGTPGGVRTHTAAILSRLPLPVGLRGRAPHRIEASNAERRMPRRTG